MIYIDCRGCEVCFNGLVKLYQVDAELLERIMFSTNWFAWPKFIQHNSLLFLCSKYKYFFFFIDAVILMN